MAGLWEILTTRPGWAFDRPNTPVQQHGTDGAERGRPVGPDRSAGGLPGDVPGAVRAGEPGRQAREEWTTPKARKGFDRSTSRLVQSGTAADFELYENEDGSFTRRVYTEPVNYRGTDGVWRPIDTRLVRGQGGRWQVAGNSVAVSFAASVGSELATVALPTGQTFGYELTGADFTAPVVDGATATYLNALPVTDVELTATRAGIKETLVLKSSAAANSWVFPLRAVGLTPRMEPDGSVAMLDAQGRPALRIPRGYMQDARVQSDGDFTTSDAVAYELITVDGGPALRVTADRSWLDDQARVYPVRVDPSAWTWDTPGDVYVDESGVRDVDTLGVGCFMESSCDKRRSFLTFAYYNLAYGAPGGSLAGVYVTSAKLHLFHTWSDNCTDHRKVYAYRATQPWSVSSMPNGSYPGASIGAQPIGELLIDNNYPACTNNQGDRSINREWVMNINDLSVFHDWSRDSSTNNGIALVSENDNDRAGWKRFVSRNYDPGGGTFAPVLELTWEYNAPPQVETQYPAHGYNSPTLTPELLVSARDPNNWPNSPLTYRFFISEVNGETVTPVADSGGYSPATSWVVPQGVLAWAKNYVWTVQAWDGKDASVSQSWNSLSTQVAQPPITSELSQNGGKGFAPNIGNYTTPATDAQVPTAGPALSIERFYNSRDPRTGSAFGRGWSTLLDAKAVESGGTVVITYPSGQDVAFGRNANGTFTPPSGRYATFTSVTGGYELVDKDSTRYRFTQALSTGRYGLTSVTDALGRALQLTYTSGGATTLTSASGRRLTVAWSGSHVSGVTNDAGEAWAYTYTGDSLTKVCPPTSTTACTVYGYGSNWAYPTVAQDLDPHTYLRFNEPAGVPTAGTSAMGTLDTAIGVYRNVTPGQPGVIAQAGTAAGFNGSSSYVELPKKIALNASWQSVSLWFKTTGSGVLYGYQGGPLTATGSGWVPALYVGTDGKLRGEFWPAPGPMTSAGVVNDGAWHHVVLTSAGNTQSLYLDGTPIGTLAGSIDVAWTTHAFVGAGKWQGWPASSGDYGYFNGSISDFAFYTRPLRDDQIAFMNASGRSASAPLTTITRPSGGRDALVAYNAATGEVTQVTDANNGVWQVGKPQVSGTGQAYASTVLSAAPVDYYRLVGTANEVNGSTGTFNNVSFGGSITGPLGETVAAFDRGGGSSMFTSGPTIDTSKSYSVSAWVYMTEKAWNQQVATVTGQRVANFFLGYSLADRWRFSVCPADIDNPDCWGVSSTSVPALNTWTHLAATVDGTTREAKLYVNGALEGSFTAQPLWKADGPLTVGRGKWNGNPGDHWPGRLAEVATFQSVLTGDQIRAQFGARDRARTYRQLPSDYVVGTGPNSVSVWFQQPAGDTTGGVIYGHQNGPLADATKWVPSLYVGTDGKLRGQFWLGSTIPPIVAPTPVNDGGWHHAVLSASSTSQDLYVDGVKVGTLAGGLVSEGTSYAYLGTGKWAGWPGGGGVLGYFSGQIADFGFHTTQLSATQVSAQFAAGRGAGLEVSGARGSPITTVKVTGPDSGETSHVYDLYAGGREVERVDPMGGRTRYGYDEKGFLRTTTDPNGNLTVSEHDVRGNVIAKVTCQNRAAGKCSTEYYSYDANDRLQTVRDGRSASSTDSNYLTTYTYDAVGNLVSMTDPLGRVTRTDYTTGSAVPADLTGLSGSGRYVRVHGTRRGSASAGYSLSTLEVFGPAGVNLVKPGGPVTASSEQAGYAAAQAVDGDPTTRWSSAVADPQWIRVDLGSAQAISRVNLIWEGGYGADYEIQVSGDGSTWTTIKAVAGQDGRPVPAGLPVRTIRPNGAVDTTHYRANGDVAETVDAVALRTRFTYDSVGRQATKTVRTEDGELATSYTYDGLGRPSTVTEPAVLNRVTGATHTKKTTTTYNVDGQVTSIRVEDLTGGDATRETLSGHNTLGQKTSDTDAAGNITHYEYDLLGRPTKVTQANGVATLTEYDKNGNRIRVKLLGWTGDPHNPHAPIDQRIESRAYDAANRLISVTDAMNWITEYHYTDDGLVRSIVRRDGSTTFVTESNVYDAAGNLIETVSNNGATTTKLTVDRASRPTAQTVDATGVNRTTTYEYGPDDSPTVTRISDGTSTPQTVDYFYDLAGRMTARQESASGTAGLAGRWKLDETAGTVAAPAMGNAYGTASGVTWSTEHGGSAVFSGGPGIAFPEPVLDTSQSYTVAAWVKLTGGAGTNRNAVSVEGDRAPAFLLGYGGDGKWQIRICAADVDNTSCPGPASVAPASLNQWSHLAATFDGSTKTVKLYVNGVAQGGGTAVAHAWKANGSLVIGRTRWNGGNSDGWQGGIDDVQVYQSTLSDSRIATIYGGSSPGDAAAARTSWRLDRRGLPVSMRDANGVATQFQHDVAGRQTVTSSVAVANEENGAAPVTASIQNTVGYNTFGEEVEVKDGRGLVTEYARDANGRVEETGLPSYTAPGSSTPLNPVVKAEYDGVGRVTKTVNALLHETSYVYDQMGRLASVTAPDGGVSRYTYTLNGQQASVTDPVGARAEATYDFLGRTLTATQVLRSPGAAHTTNFAYNTAGWLHTVTPPGRAATTHTYNAVGEVVRVVDGAGVATEFGYDVAGRKTSTRLADGSKQTVGYDFAGRPVTQQLLDAAANVYSTVSATFDAVGNQLTGTDARGTVSRFGYDAVGRLVQAVQPASVSENITTSFGYDAVGNRTRFTDGRAGVFVTTYNSWNLPESRVEPATAAHPGLADRTFTTVYDAAGRPVEARSPGGVSVTNTFDAMGRLTRSAGAGAEASTVDRVLGYDLAGRVTSLSGSGGTNTLSYDDRGLLTSAAGPSGSSSFAYTPDGLMASRQDAAGTTSYGYDAGGRLTSLSNPDAALQIGYTYNSLSQVSQITLGSNQNRRDLGYAADGSHRLLTDELKTSTGTSIAKITYGWDKNGNLTSKTAAGFTSAGSNTYVYDLANRLTSWTSGAGTVDYGWDRSGNRYSAGSRTYTYDERNRLASANDGTTYTYSARGTLRTSTTGTVTRVTDADAFGQVISQESSQYAYDGLGRLVRTGFHYTGAGNDLAADPTGKYVRTAGGAVAGVQTTGAGVYAWTDLHRDIVGQFGATSATLTGSSCFDPFGKTVSSTGMLGSLGYQSGWTDTGTGRVNMHSRWYNPDTGQFDTRDGADLSPVPASIAANRYAYANANPLANIDPNGHAPMATGSEAEEATYFTALTPAQRSAHLAAINNTYRKAKNLAPLPWDHYLPKEPPVNEINFGQPTEPTPHRIKDGACHGGNFEDTDGGGLIICDAGVSNLGDYLVGTFKFAPNEVNCSASLANSGLTPRASDSGRYEYVPFCGTVLKHGDSVTLDYYARTAFGMPFKDLDREQQTYVLWSAYCQANPTMCSNTDSTANEAFRILVSLIPVVGTIVDGIDCLGGNRSACAWTAMGLLPLAGLAKLTKFGKLGESILKSINADTRALTALHDIRLARTGHACSFTGDTKILMADGSTKPIATLVAGDRVHATDPETGKNGPRPVTATWVHEDEIVTLDINGDTLETTANHPFWNDTDQQWQRADQLDPGDKVLSTNGKQIQTQGITGTLDSKRPAYNLTIADLHTYYVLAGQTPILVHNTGPGGCWAAGDDVLDEIFDEFGPEVAQGVEWNIARFNEGATGHALNGIGTDAQATARYLASQKNFNYVDINSGHAISYDAANQILIIRTAQDVHAYNYSATQWANNVGTRYVER